MARSSKVISSWRFRQWLRGGVGLVVFCLLASMLFYLWMREKKQAREEIRQLTNQYADEAASRIGSFLYTRVALLRSLHQLIQSRGYPGDSTFQREASILYDAVSGYQAINWIDQSGRIALIYPEMGNEPALGKDLHKHPDAAPTFLRAERTGAVSITPPVRLLQGGIGLATYWPVDDNNGRRIGYINGVFNLRKSFAEALRGLAGSKDIHVEILADSGAIFTFGRRASGKCQPAVREVVLGPNHWTVRVAAGEKLRAAHSGHATASWFVGGLVLVAAVASLTQMLSHRQDEYRRARDEARTSEARFRSILEASPYRIYAFDRDLRLLFESPSGAKLTGYAAGDWPDGRISPQLYVEPNDVEEVERGIRAALKGETRLSQPFRIRTKGGKSRWFRAVWAPLHDRDGSLLGGIGMETDCTEEQEALQRLRDSEEWNRLLIDSLQSMLVVMTPEATVHMVNPVCGSLLRVGLVELVGTQFTQWVSPEDRDRFQRDLENAAQGNVRQGPIRYTLQARNGDSVIVEARWSCLRREDELLGLLLIGTDVTARVRAEKALEASEKRFRALFENVPEAVFVFDPVTYRILDVNQTAVRRYGWTREEFRRMSVLDIRPPEQVPVAQKLIQSYKPGRSELLGEYLHKKKDGTVFPVLIYRQALELEGKPLIIAVAVDLTERKRAEREQERLRQQLLQAQRMEAIGNLAGGIAHDFNNMLTGIMGLADLVLHDTHPGQPGHDEAAQIKKVCQRASDLIGQLLAFSRRQIIAPKPISLNDVIREMAPLIRQAVGERVDLKLDLDPAVPPALADRAQVEQVVLNLAVNARDAMPTGGTLNIRTFKQTVRAEHVRERSAEPGNYVVLCVSDTGVGMDEETRAHIFEPFYTTKQSGKGTGLGLAVVYGIVEQHRGFIELDSEPGRGTTFRIYWPEASGEAQVVDTRPQSGGEQSGKGTILVVEDEDVVRTMAARSLRRLGYHVLEARDGQEALTILQNQQHVDLIFTDVVMPGMSGMELYEQVQKTHPEIRFLFSSGYTTDGVHENFVLAENLHFLAKPYDSTELAAKIREVLQSAGRA